MAKALMVYGGWEGHEPEQATALVAGWLTDAGLTVERGTSLEPFADPQGLGRYDVVVPCVTCGTLTGEQEAGLCAAVMEGVGIAGWHGGIVDAFRNNPTYQFMTGGQFVAHPGGIIKYRVNITDREHPIVSGVGDFEVRSEQYYMHVDPGLKVLASTRFSGEHESKPWITGVTMPTVWTKPWGKGRVFVSAIGHVAADLIGPEVKAITTRGILWAAGKL
ncbi:MAG: ThuA domain-containing protein [Phycisphaerales bacterium]|nr:ThuA domain-containing protein [Phycisphaerales bacterium]